MFSGDSLSYHKDRRFSTKDADHDTINYSCSTENHGAWWYGSCHYSNLNGQYYKGSETPAHAVGVLWVSWTGWRASLKTVTMKMRSATFPGQLYHVFILMFCTGNCLYVTKCSPLHPPLANLHRPCGICCKLSRRD